jgi:APA family basic amino acid/polyamine antiporter
VFITGILLLLALTGAFEFLMRFMMAVAFSVDLVVLAGIFLLRRKFPDLKRPLKVPAYPLLPAVTVLLYLLVLGTIVGTQPGLGLGAAVMLGALGLASWFTLRTSI